MLKQLNKLNHSIKILSVDSTHLTKYGKVITDCDFSDMFDQSINAVDLSGPTYIRDFEDLHKCESYKLLKESVFGEINLQTGLCFGLNNKMNGMEYHKSSEVIITVTDLILILGDMRDIINNSWDSSLAEFFFIPKGIAVELYGGTLHLAPCRVSSEPFCAIIVLPENTNSPLISETQKHDSLLFMNNKWLLCHKDSPAVKKGGYIGIQGENIQITTT